MKKFIPYEKLSKKKKRELDRKKRVEWKMNPVARKPENPKAYKRRKTHLWDDPSGGSFFCADAADRAKSPSSLRTKGKLIFHGHLFTT